MYVKSIALYNYVGRRGVGMGKRHHHHYEVIDTNQVLTLVKSGALTDEQRAWYFDRVVREYAAQLQSCQEENTALSEEVAVLSKGIARRDAKIAQLCARVDELMRERKRGSKRRGSNGHCGPKRHWHKDKYATSEPKGADASPSDEAASNDEEVDYEAIAAKYADLEEPEDDAGCEENVASVAGDE